MEETNKEYLIEQFRKINHAESLVLTQHSRKRFEERGIKIVDVIEIINMGEIIEQYPEDYPFPSCLNLGKIKDRYIHVCASINENLIYIITAYEPDLEKWNDDRRTRKELFK